MDLLWIILLGFLVYDGAESKAVVKVKAELGQSVILNCSLTEDDFYWYMDIHSGLRSCIVRTLSKDVTQPQYFVDTLSKYRAMKGQKLNITNITTYDFRNYYCAKKQSDNILFEDTILLYSEDVPQTVSTSAPSTNTTTTQPHTHRMSQKELVVYSSFTLNIILSAATVILIALLCMERKTCCRQVDNPSPLTPENPENVETVQYEEIQLSPSRLPPAALLYDGIYSKAQLPQSVQPPQGHLDNR
ncbi:uncharacterized protein LOC121506406 isoform X1 [Xyrichtys novacula]|uniref:Uncharacterized protein LOC121506406 isoform X1 n=1 Tax=Xyrichtys novacula TaxID=13765 RepID=A0AAV1HNG8_XYRNO|nr:uncharacterized protein LOC121506406 isoform X1 [Xyrichtys novacula]